MKIKTLALATVLALAGCGKEPVIWSIEVQEKYLSFELVKEPGTQCDSVPGGILMLRFKSGDVTVAQYGGASKENLDSFHRYCQPGDVISMTTQRWKWTAEKQLERQAFLQKAKQLAEGIN